MRGAAARRLLAGTRFADVRWVGETGSTNADATELARAGAPDGVVVVADHQTGGRGRLGRTWTAPPASSLLCSVLMRPDLAVDSAHLLANALGVAVVEACRDVAGVAAGLKWPNDVVAGDRKLGGILAESVSTRGRVDAVVVGVGLNVEWPAELLAALPAGSGGGATSLSQQRLGLAGALDRELLLVAILERLDRLDPTSPPFAARYRSLLATLGRQVRVELETGTVEGTAVDVTPAGHLVVDSGAGGRRSFAVADVVHLRTVAP